MKKRLIRRKSGRKRGRFEEELTAAPFEASKSKTNAKGRIGAFHAAGPLFGFNIDHPTGSGQKKGPNKGLPSKKAETGRNAVPLPPLHGRKKTDQVSVHTGSSPLRLRGRTDAEFSYTYETRNVTAAPATGCRNCPETSCIRCRGTLIIRYHVRTTVTLPSVSDFPDLTTCQQRRVQNAIDNVLAPHEQEHVRAFNAYAGTTRSRFDLTLCRSEFESTIQNMVDSEESARRDTAQAASDALDPFHFDVDLDCEDDA